MANGLLTQLEPKRARGIIVLVKCNPLVKKKLRQNNFS